MGLDIIPNSDQVELADKKPVSTMLVVALILLGIVSAALIRFVTTNREDNTAQLKSISLENKDLKEENKQLRTEMFRMVLEKDAEKAAEKEELKKNTDSVIREAFKKNN